MINIKQKFNFVLLILILSMSSHAQTSLSFLHKWPEPENMAYFEKAVKIFEENNPDIKIKMEAVADEPYKDKIRVLMASNQVPDIFFSWSGEFAKKFVRGERVLDITKEVYDSGWHENFSEAALSPFKFNDKQYGIPINVNAKFMLYNQDIFNQYNLSTPHNFEELITICQTLKSKGISPIAFGNQYPWAASHYIGSFFAALVPNEIRLADFELTSDTDTLYTHEGYVKSLNLFKQLNDEGCFNRGSNALTHAIARGSFTASRNAMMFMELTEFFQINNTKLEQDGWDFFTLPVSIDAEGEKNFITGAPDGFMISTTTTNKDAAIKFLEFLTSKEEGEKYVKITGMTSAVNGSVNLNNSDEKTLKGMEILSKSEGLALWLDTDMDAQSTEVLLSGSQAIINGTETAELIMEKVRNTAIEVKNKR